MKTNVTKAKAVSTAKVAAAAGKPAGGSIVEYARSVAANPTRARAVARDAGITTKTGRLTAAYK